MTPLRFSAAALAALVLLSSSRPAAADDDPRRAQADAVFQEGLKLHDAGQEKEALEKFRKAYATYPSPNALFQIARSEHILTDYVLAIRHYREALKNPLLHPKNAKLAKEFILDLERKLARVEVVGPSGATAKIADVTVTLPLGEPLDVEPGTILASATSEGQRFEGRVVALSGRVTRLELAPTAATEPAATAPTPEPEAATAPPPSFETPPPAPPERGFWDTGRIAGVAALGVGAVGIGAGVLFGASSNDDAERADALQRQLGPSACAGASPPAACAELNDARDAQDRNATLSTVFIVGGAAIAATGAALVLWPRKGGPQLAPSAGRNGAGLLLSGSF